MQLSPRINERLEQHKIRRRKRLRQSESHKQNYTYLGLLQYLNTWTRLHAENTNKISKCIEYVEDAHGMVEAKFVAAAAAT